MHRREQAEQELDTDRPTDRSVETTSDDQPGGRHRAIATGADRARRTIRSLGSSHRVRFGLAAGIACCLGLVAFVESRAGTAPDGPPPPATTLAERAAEVEEQPASRATERAPVPTPSITATPTATPRPSAVRTTAARKKPAKPARPQPVAGLTQAQMDNAHVIVQVGAKLDVPRKGLVIAIATAMQESNLYNLASGVLPESQNYPNQGVGWDHDSVGLFQQRPSSGWGTIQDLMRPAYAAERFYRALLAVPGWQDMSLSMAAQSVQISAFPDAYAPHEDRATTVVAALI